jgi:hypothetical protein
MGSTTEASVLAALERAEMAARERRLAASTEAERIASLGRDRTSAISAQAVDRVADALEALQKQAESEADAAIEALELEAARWSREQATSSDGDPIFEQATELVVALVLGERSLALEQEAGP